MASKAIAATLKRVAQARMYRLEKRLVERI
jgi:hypothetical protein